MNFGIKTYKQIAAENGTDWRTQIDDMAEVLEYASEKGIDLGGVLFDGKLNEEREEQKEYDTAAGGNSNAGDPDAAGADGTDGRQGSGQREG